MSDNALPISLYDARALERRVRDLVVCKKPDLDTARKLVAQFSAGLFEDFAKHGDNRIRGICAIITNLNKMVAAEE